MKKPDVRKVLLQYAASVPDSSVGVLLSGGIDSAAVMFSLLASGKKVTAYAFTLDGRMSTDFSLARRNATAFGCEFVPVFLPVSVSQLKADLLTLKRYGAKKKTDYECAWPMLYAYAAVRERVVASGMGADGHFCISKKGMIHWRDRIDEFRLVLYRSPTYAQQPIHARIAAAHNKAVLTPYLTDDMRREFLGTTWSEVNRPQQKQPILDAFPAEFRRIRVLPHVNLQLGDSGIAAHFTKLLASDWNAKRYKSVQGIYNLLNQGVLK